MGTHFSTGQLSFWCLLYDGALQPHFLLSTHLLIPVPPIISITCRVLCACHIFKRQLRVPVIQDRPFQSSKRNMVNALNFQSTFWGMRNGTKRRAPFSLTITSF